MVPLAGPDCLSVLLCQVVCSRGGAGGAVLLSGRSVERRSDGGHFSSAGGAHVRIKVSGYLCIKCSCDLVGRCGD
jgi:hypothetical protein